MELKQVLLYMIIEYYALHNGTIANIRIFYAISRQHKHIAYVCPLYLDYCSMYMNTLSHFHNCPLVFPSDKMHNFVCFFSHAMFLHYNVEYSKKRYIYIRITVITLSNGSDGPVQTERTRILRCRT